MENALYSSREFEELTLKVNRIYNHYDHDLDYQICWNGINVDGNRNNKKSLAASYSCYQCKAIMCREWERVYFSFFSAIFTQVPIQECFLPPLHPTTSCKAPHHPRLHKNWGKTCPGQHFQLNFCTDGEKGFLEHVYPHSIACSVSRRIMEMKLLFIITNKWPCFCARYCWGNTGWHLSVQERSSRSRDTWGVHCALPGGAWTVEICCGWTILFSLGQNGDHCPPQKKLHPWSI